MSLITFIVLLLIVVAAGLTWLIRANLVVWLTCLALAPLPATAVLALFPEQIPGVATASLTARFAIALVICYVSVWLALLAGWLSTRIQRT